MTKIRDREQLLDAAAKIFAEKGFEAARLEDIAAELGVLPGSLYYHINSKAELLALVQRRRLLEITERMECIAGAEMPPREKLAAALREHLHHLVRFHPESAQWFKAASPTEGVLHEELHALNKGYVRVIEGIIRQGVAAGELRSDLDPGIAVLGVMGMCNWLPRWYRPDGRMSIDQITDTFIPMVLDGLRAA